MYCSFFHIPYIYMYLIHAMLRMYGWMGMHNILADELFVCENFAACSVTGYRKINNGTSQFTCSINPTEYFPNQHASGDCTMPEGALPFDILVA